jgi:hypothetical protein
MAAGKVLGVGTHWRIVAGERGQAGVLWEGSDDEAPHLWPSSRMAQTQDVVASFGQVCQDELLELRCGELDGNQRSSGLS